MPRGFSGTWAALVAKRQGFKGGAIATTGVTIELPPRDATTAEATADPDALLDGAIDDGDTDDGVIEPTRDTTGEPQGSGARHEG